MTFFTQVHAAATFGHTIHRAIGAAIAASTKSFWQQLHERRHGWKHRAGSCRIDVTHFHAVRGMRCCALCKLFKCYARALVRIAQQWRARTTRNVIHRQQIRAVARCRIARRAPRKRKRLAFLWMIFAKHRAKKLRERRIESVQPHHRLRAEIAVIMPRPVRRHHKIPRRHRRALAVHRRVRALAFDDEAQRVGCMPVRRRDLAGQYDLQAGK